MIYTEAERGVERLMAQKVAQTNELMRAMLETALPEQMEMYARELLNVASVELGLGGLVVKPRLRYGPDGKVL